MLKVILPWPARVLHPNRKHGQHWGRTNSAKGRRAERALVKALQMQQEASQ